MLSKRERRYGGAERRVYGNTSTGYSEGTPFSARVRKCLYYQYILSKRNPLSEGVPKNRPTGCVILRVLRQRRDRLVFRGRRSTVVSLMLIGRRKGRVRARVFLEPEYYSV